MPVTLSSILKVLIDLILTIIFYEVYYYLHFTDEKTGRQRFKKFPTDTEVVFDTWM